MNVMTDLDFFSSEVREWKNSAERMMQIKGFLYYRCEHDILHRQRTAIGENGEIVVVNNLPNNRVIDNQYGKMVNQKVDYLLGKPFVVSCENKDYERTLKRVFNASFRRMLKSAGKALLCGGIVWIYPFYDEEGKFSFRFFPAYEILPFWKDSSHTVLDCALRVYRVEAYDGFSKKVVERAELFTKDGVKCYVFENGRLVPDKDAPECIPYLKARGKNGDTYPLGWGKVPLVAVKYGETECPLLKRVKSLQDGINAMLSDFQNNMQEDARNTILVLKNYDGEDLGEFRRNLAAYGAVKVRCDGDAKGGVDTLSVGVNAENYTAILDLLKKALVENAMGYNTRDNLPGVNLNQMNIQSMYSDMDLDANDMETELQASFEEILWFVNMHLRNTTGADFSGEDVTFVFNRDTLINEADAIAGCAASVGLLSEETIIEQHPWVNDVDKELRRLERERANKLPTESG